jgi:hypothetical protein
MENGTRNDRGSGESLPQRSTDEGSSQSSCLGSERLVRLMLGSRRCDLRVRVLMRQQEYELAEDEIKISLDRFRSDYCNPDGSVK